MVLDEISLEVGGHLIVCQSTRMYLGVLLHIRLKWVPYIKYIAGNTLRTINVLRVIVGFSWGADPAVLALFIGIW